MCCKGNWYESTCVYISNAFCYFLLYEKLKFMYFLYLETFFNIIVLTLSFIEKKIRKAHNSGIDRKLYFILFTYNLKLKNRKYNCFTYKVLLQKKWNDVSYLEFLCIILFKKKIEDSSSCKNIFLSGSPSHHENFWLRYCLITIEITVLI